MKRESFIACPLVGTAALDAANLPDSIPLLRWGKNETAQGVFIVNERTAAAISAQVSGGLRDRVLLDYEHSSEKFHPNYQPPPRKHAAAGTPVCSSELGLALAGLAWTPSGREFALEYPDLSAAVDFDRTTREVTGLRSAALCKQGAAVHGSAFFALNETTPENPMEELLKAAQAAIEALTARVAALEGKLGKSESDAAAAMSAAETLKTDFAALSAERVKERKLAILDGAKREGKVVALADSAVAALSVDDLAAHVATLQPGQVPLKRRTGTEGAAALSVDDVMAQYNAIKDPEERAAFYNAHRSELFG